VINAAVLNLKKKDIDILPSPIMDKFIKLAL
jgi:hypothetical protein